MQHKHSIVFAVPNGGGRDLIEGVRLKEEGVLAGVADLIIIHRGEVVFVEMKTKGGRQSAAQKAFEEAVSAQGFQYHICRSITDFTSLFPL